MHLLFNLAGAGIWLGVFWLVKLLAAPAILDRAVTLPGVAVIHTAFNLLCTAALFPAAGLLERAVLRLLPGEETPSAEPDPRLLAAPAAALERCRELTLEMADLARDNLRRGIQALTEVHPDSARELRRQEARIDGLEDALGTFLVRLGGRTLTRRDSARAAELLMLIGDLERLGDHAMNLLESGEELRDRKIELPPEDRRQLRVLTEAVEEIADLALAAFRREDAAALGQVEALEQVIDGLRQRLRARRIRETQPGEGAMELSFVWSDVLTDLERAADHCCNIMECVADLSAGNRNLHAAQLAARQRDPAFDSRVQAYEQKYRIKKACVFGAIAPNTQAFFIRSAGPAGKRPRRWRRPRSGNLPRGTWEFSRYSRRRRWWRRPGRPPRCPAPWPASAPPAGGDRSGPGSRPAGPGPRF